MVKGVQEGECYLGFNQDTWHCAINSPWEVGPVSMFWWWTGSYPLISGTEALNILISCWWRKTETRANHPQVVLWWKICYLINEYYFRKIMLKWQYWKTDTWWNDQETQDTCGCSALTSLSLMLRQLNISRDTWYLMILLIWTRRCWWCSWWWRRGAETLSTWRCSLCGIWHLSDLVFKLVKIVFLNLYLVSRWVEIVFLVNPTVPQSMWESHFLIEIIVFK